MAATTGAPKTVAFLGASTGIGLAALTRALAAGHTCVALCRKPSKLTDRFPADKHPNLHVVEGNAHDLAAVSRCLYVPSSAEGQGQSGQQKELVDVIVSSIGGAFIFSRMTLDDPQVCEKGATTLLEAIAKVRQEQENSSNPAAATWKPRVVVVSSTGLAKAGRDYPLAMTPMYKFMLKVPHADKVLMEKAVVDGAAGAAGGYAYTYTIVRPSLLVDDAAPKREVRIGVDDDYVVGYTISRDDTGRWIYENLLRGDEGKYENRVATVTW